MDLGKTNETAFLKAIDKAIAEEKRKADQLQSLRTWRTHVNLAALRFDELWHTWYPRQAPPKLEVDLLCVYPEAGSPSDEVVLIAVEMKYFHRTSKGNFYSGFDQILAFSLFGFDGLSLLHVFSSDVGERMIKGDASAASELIQGYGLPLFYLAARVGDDFQALRLSSYAPAETTGGIDHYLTWMWNNVRDKRNPLLESHEVKRRRRTIKVLLRIP